MGQVTSLSTTAKERKHESAGRLLATDLPFCFMSTVLATWGFAEVGAADSPAYSLARGHFFLPTGY